MQTRLTWSASGCGVEVETGKRGEVGGGPVPEVSAVELPVGLRHPASLLSMVMNGDAGPGTFFPLSPCTVF